MSLKKIYFKKYYLLFAFFLVASCSNSGQLINKDIAKLQQNNLSSSQKDYLKDFEVKPSNKDYLLYNQEAGRIAFIINDTPTSIAKFNNAIRYYKEQEDIARLNDSDATKSALSSTLLDDNVMDYKGSEYERAFVHFYQSLNYLKNKDIEKALVEIRASNDAQKFAIAKREGKINKAESKIAKYNFSPSIGNALKDVEGYRSDFKSGFLNALIYYVSGNMREIYGDKNGALVDYKNAYELSPNNSFVLSDLLRLSQDYDNGYFNNVMKLKPEAKFINNKDYKKQKTILIVYEDHFISQKKELAGSVYLYQVDKFAKISLPVYEAPSKLTNPTLLFNGNWINFEYSTNVYNLAKNELAEKYPDILFRQISRLVTKMTMQNVGNKINNDDPQGVAVIKLVLGIFGAVSSLAETADLRSYRTLPQRISVLKINTEDSLNEFRINHNGKQLDLSKLDIQNGEFVILYVVDTGNSLYYNAIYKSNK